MYFTFRRRRLLPCAVQNVYVAALVLFAAIAKISIPCAVLLRVKVFPSDFLSKLHSRQHLYIIDA